MTVNWMDDGHVKLSLFRIAYCLLLIDSTLPTPTPPPTETKKKKKEWQSEPKLPHLIGPYLSRSLKRNYFITCLLNMLYTR